MLISLATSIFAPTVQAATDQDSSPFIIESETHIAPDQYSGAFNYEYPFTVPPGRNNLQPTLVLSYSSANTDAGNVFGYGWGLSIPKIERLSKHGSDDLYSRHDFSSSLSGEL